MHTKPFSERLRDVLADAIVMRPDDIAAEAHGNQSSFSLSRAEAAGISVAEVEAFAVEVANGRRAWLAARGADPMILYWWHDSQAGQLRCSLVSVSHRRLPFGCRTMQVPHFSDIAADWLGSQHLDGIPLDELDLSVSSEAVDPTPSLLPFWSTRLP